MTKNYYQFYLYIWKQKNVRNVRERWKRGLFQLIVWELYHHHFGLKKLALSKDWKINTILLLTVVNLVAFLKATQNRVAPYLICPVL